MNIHSSVPRRPLVRLSFWSGLLAVAFLLVVGTACDTLQADDATADVAASEDAITLDALITNTAAPLDLSGSQSDQMGDVARRFEGEPPEPGALWTAAAEMHATLTPEQIDSLETRLRTMAERIANRRGNGPGNGPGFGRGMGGPGMGGPGMSGPGMGGPGMSGNGMGPGGPGAGLDLTDEQRDDLRAIRDAYREQFADLLATYEDGTVSESEAATAYVELAAAMRDEVHAVLTEEQRAQIEERRAEGSDRRAAMQDARNTALALSDLQADGINALRQLERGPRRARLAGDFDAWLTARDALLTDVQTEITIVHASLVAEHVRQRMQNRRGPGGGFGGPGGGPGGGGFGN